MTGGDMGSVFSDKCGCYGRVVGGQRVTRVMRVLSTLFLLFGFVVS